MNVVWRLSGAMARLRGLWPVRFAASRFNRVLVGLVLAIVVASTLIVRFKIKERADTIEAASRYASQVAAILAEQVAQSALSIDLMLDTVVDTVAVRSTSEAFLKRAADRQTYDQLLAALARLPQSDVITITDASGRMIASTRGFPHPAVDLSDRDYFRHFRSGGRGLFVSAPVHNKVTGAWTVYFAKAVLSRNDELLGLVLIGVKPAIFIQSRQTLVSFEGQSFGLFRRDGLVLLRRDADRDHTGETVPESSPWHALVRHTGGVYRSPGYFDGVARYVAVAPLQAYPLVIDVAMDEQRILAPWRRRNLRALVYFAVAICLMGLLLAALRREHRMVTDREKDLQRALRDESQASAAIEYQALHDSLTGLSNRAAFTKRITELQQSATPQKWALFLLDLDGFKIVNDCLGHDVGDELLKEVAMRLGAADSDFAGRLGGDEFVLLYACDGSEEQVRDLATRLIALIGEPYVIDGKRVTVQASVGIKIFASDTCEFRRIMRRADLALNEAKRRGKNCFRLFDRDMDAIFEERAMLAAELRDAVARCELEVHYQPIVRADTCEIVKREALLRWRHPERGSISPAIFIPLAEEIGLITTIGKWVLGRACRDAMTWTDRAKVSVNVSPLQITQGRFDECVAETLAETGLSPGRLELEITESVFLHSSERNIATLHILNSSGVDIALDDFGTGYASLSYMKCFPFSSIKIDRSFIVDVHCNRSSVAIIAAITGLAHALNLSTTAEGVETAEQYETLRAAGVDNMQGYLFGRPAPLLAPLAGSARPLPEKAA